MKNLKERIIKARSKEFIKFCIVGIICTFIDTAVFYASLQFSNYKISLILGYLTGLIFNSFFTLSWTFKQDINFRNIFTVICIHLFNLFIIRMGLMNIATEIIKINAAISYLPIVAISVISNFLLIRTFLNKINTNE